MSPPPDVVRQETVIQASPDLVFEAWADPEEIAAWYVERAEGDPREERIVEWYLGEEPEPLEVTTCQPGEHLVLTNVSVGPWRGTILDIELTPVGDGTRLVLTQETTAHELAGFVPIVDSGWACSLAILKVYLEDHAGRSRWTVEARRPIEPDPELTARALASGTTIEAWSGQMPERVLASTPHGAVVGFPGFPGVFTMMAANEVVVWYSTWDDEELDPVEDMVAALADRLLERVDARAPPEADPIA